MWLQERTGTDAESPLPSSRFGIHLIWVTSSANSHISSNTLKLVTTERRQSLSFIHNHRGEVPSQSWKSLWLDSLNHMPLSKQSLWPQTCVPWWWVESAKGTPWSCGLLIKGHTTVTFQSPFLPTHLHSSPSVHTNNGFINNIHLCFSSINCCGLNCVLQKCVLKP